MVRRLLLIELKRLSRPAINCILLIATLSSAFLTALFPVLPGMYELIGMENDTVAEAVSLMLFGYGSGPSSVCV